jgi:hypothetical protein
VVIDYDQAGNRIRDVDAGTPAFARDWVEYEYDGDGNRIKKTTHRYFHGERSTRVTTYRWDRTFALPMLVSQQGQAQDRTRCSTGTACFSPTARRTKVPVYRSRFPGHSSRLL